HGKGLGKLREQVGIDEELVGSRSIALRGKAELVLRRIRAAVVDKKRSYTRRWVKRGLTYARTVQDTNRDNVGCYQRIARVGAALLQRKRHGQSSAGRSRGVAKRCEHGCGVRIRLRLRIGHNEIVELLCRT